MTVCNDNKDFVILRIHAGPPYEDIAFKIVNREWEYGYKRGFRFVRLGSFNGRHQINLVVPENINAQLAPNLVHLNYVNEDPNTVGDINADPCFRASSLVI